MKREEEIFQTAKEVGEFIADTSPSTYNAALRGFCRGAEFADKTMLDRACEWLKDGGYFVNSNETIEDFRKAMEGGAE